VTAKGEQYTSVRKELSLFFGHPQALRHGILSDDARDFTGEDNDPALENLARSAGFREFELRETPFGFAPSPGQIGKSSTLLDAPRDFAHHLAEGDRAEALEAVLEEGRCVRLQALPGHPIPQAGNDLRTRKAVSDRKHRSTDPGDQCPLPFHPDAALLPRLRICAPCGLTNTLPSGKMGRLRGRMKNTGSSHGQREADGRPLG
jgi:hypothetical protein